MIPARATVIRDGTQSQIAAAELVIGDVVFVRLGDKVPADFYVFHGADFKVDNSSLTGESEPQDRVASNSHENPLEVCNRRVACFQEVLRVEPGLFMIFQP